MERYPLTITMHSAYKHLYKWWDDNGIPFYNDKHVLENTKPGAMALLIEPRSLLPEVYEYIEKNYNKFIYVFTHDSKLLKELPNAKLIIWGGIWDSSDMDKDFSHPISMVASQKGGSAVRIARRDLAFELKGRIDTYGTFDGGERADTKTIYGKYPFSVVIENHIDDWWITEKICNCFANGCIPIYYGARKIDELFNKDGIIHAHSIEEVKQHVDYILEHAKEEYNKRIYAIEDNKILVKEYANFDNWFMSHYEKLLRGIYEAVDYYPILQYGEIHS